MIRHGIILETGSHGRAQPYGIRPDLYANPLAFYDSTVRPLIKSGVDSILWHRPFGEPTQGDAGQDFDTINFHFTEGNRQFAMDLARILDHVSKQIHLTIYLGAIWQDRMHALLNAGQYQEWARRIELQVLMFPDCRFAFDGSSNRDQMREADYAAIALLNARKPGSVMVEALPDDEAKAIHGLPGLVWENVWQTRWQQAKAKNAGSVTRVLTMHSPDTDPIWFAADCAAKGHGWYVAPGVLAKHGVSFDAMKREAA